MPTSEHASSATDEPITAPSEVPEWVEELRAKGYGVRVGTNTRGLPYYPEVSFHDSEEPRHRIRRRIVDFVRDLWIHARKLRRIVNR